MTDTAPFIERAETRPRTSADGRTLVVERAQRVETPSSAGPFVSSLGSSLSGQHCSVRWVSAASRNALAVDFALTW